MEKLIADAITKDCKLFDKHQHGFRTAHSTGTQLVEVAHRWALTRNHGNPIHGIYLDFSHAFDKAGHCFLLKKLVSLRIGQRVLSWCESYSCGPTFRVKVGDRLSQLGSYMSTVPQGSRIGPLLYSIFIQILGKISSSLLTFPIKSMPTTLNICIDCK